MGIYCNIFILIIVIAFLFLYAGMLLYFDCDNMFCIVLDILQNTIIAFTVYGIIVFVIISIYNFFKRK